MTPAILVKRPHNEDRKENTIEEAKKVKIEKSQEHCSQARFKDLTLTHPSKYITPAQCGFVDLMPVNRSLPTAIAVPNTTEKGTILCAIMQDLKPSNILIYSLF